jgi:hypothetical protein
MNSHMRTMRLFTFGEEVLSRNFEETRVEHERILAAFQSRDKAQVVQAITDHLRSVKNRVQRLAPLYSPAEAGAKVSSTERRRARLAQGRHSEVSGARAARPG